MDRDHGRGLKQQPAWTPGHNYSLAAAGCFSSRAQRSPPPPPPSSYTCGYCRREFRSAQALGGHMNVHRRDRARLRQCCPAMYPPPGAAGLIVAAHHRAVAAAAPPHHHPRLPNLNFVPPHATAEPPVVYSFFSAATATAAMKAAAVEVNLDLGMGGVCNRGGVAEDGGLDLELRLGCSWE